jgi:hypothetical protein
VSSSLTETDKRTRPESPPPSHDFRWRNESKAIREAANSNAGEKMTDFSTELVAAKNILTLIVSHLGYASSEAKLKSLIA